MSVTRIDVEYAGCSRCAWTDESPFAQVHLDNHWQAVHAGETPSAWDVALGERPGFPRVMGWTQSVARRAVEQERLRREGRRPVQPRRGRRAA